MVTRRIPDPKIGGSIPSGVTSFLKKKNTLPTVIFSLTLMDAMKRRRKLTKATTQNTVTDTTAHKESKGSLTFRLDDDLELRMMKVCAIVGIDKSALGRMCLEAVVKMIERDQQLSLPLEITPTHRSGSSVEV